MLLPFPALTKMNMLGRLESRINITNALRNLPSFTNESNKFVNFEEKFIFDQLPMLDNNILLLNILLIFPTYQ